MFPSVSTPLIIGLAGLWAFPKVYAAWFPNYAEMIIKLINDLAEKNAFANKNKTGMLQWTLAANTEIGTALLLKLIDQVHSYRLWGKYTWNVADEFKKIQAQGGSSLEQNKKLTDLITAKKEALLQALANDFKQYNLSLSQLRLFYNQVDQLQPIDGPLYTYWWGGRTRLDNAKLAGWVAVAGVGGYYLFQGYKRFKK
jgi:hypothetical protein